MLVEDMPGIVLFDQEREMIIDESDTASSCNPAFAELRRCPHSPHARIPLQLLPSQQSADVLRLLPQRAKAETTW